MNRQRQHLAFAAFAVVLAISVGTVVGAMTLLAVNVAKVRLAAPPPAAHSCDRQGDSPNLLALLDAVLRATSNYR